MGLYIERWLKAPVQMEDGSIVPRTAGTPQGGVISPLLANLFLHYAFDMWMARTYPHIPFERYADDIICHCKSAEEARALWSALADRFAACKLVLHPQKTKLVYCKDAVRRGNFLNQSFAFLGFMFRARRALGRGGRSFVGFLPAASPKALTSISRTIRRWALHHHSDKSLQDLAKEYNQYIEGWINYYGQFYRTQLRSTLIGLMSMSSAGRAGNSNGCVIKPKGRHDNATMRLACLCGNDRFKFRGVMNRRLKSRPSREMWRRL
jgi:group II intron reverse transcriptase/maturase